MDLREIKPIGTEEGQRQRDEAREFILKKAEDEQLEKKTKKAEKVIPSKEE